jgi:hypothetical protein
MTSTSYTKISFLRQSKHRDTIIMTIYLFMFRETITIYLTVT